MWSFSKLNDQAKWFCEEKMKRREAKNDIFIILLVKRALCTRFSKCTCLPTCALDCTCFSIFITFWFFFFFFNRPVSPALPQRIVCVRIWFAMRKRSHVTSVGSSCLPRTSRITCGCTTSHSITPATSVTAVSTAERGPLLSSMMLSSCRG